VDPTLSSQVDSTFITYDDLRSEEYGKLNPLRKVPALVRGDGGTVFESDVILKYLAVWNSNVGRPTLSP
jgi:glutathione S-transferase